MESLIVALMPNRWIACLLPGLLLYFAPIPGLDTTQRHLVAVFAATIIALMLRPVPMGVSVLLAMTLLAVTGTVPASRALLGFSNQTVWLIFSAYLFSYAIASTGLGRRVAYLLIRRFASTPLRLGYAVVSAGILIAPFVPSDTARGGGVIFPVTDSLARAFAAEPRPPGRNIGSFLMLVCFHGNYLASAVFLTSMVANPLIASFASKIAGYELTWLGWLAGSCVPALLSLLAVPAAISRWHSPGAIDTAPARELAARGLAEMGKPSGSERRLTLILLFVMLGWITSPWHGIGNAYVALLGVCAQLLTGLITWEALLARTQAWDVLLWFAPLLMMADELNTSGVIGVVSRAVFPLLGGLSPLAVALAGALAYFYLHYVFASMTAHTTALYPAFLAALLAAGAPAGLTVLLLAYFSNLFAGLTHYGTGSAPVFFGAGYVREGEWWRIGFLVSLVNTAIWIGAGLLWWRVLGIW